MENLELRFKQLKSQKYREDNYKIIDFNNDKKICLIFCSSNGLYRKDVASNIKILESDKYDWDNISNSKRLLKIAGKYIFIRDIFCHTYVDGINERINTIDRIINFLKEETKGCSLYLIGHSGGRLFSNDSWIYFRKYD